MDYLTKDHFLKTERERANNAENKITEMSKKVVNQHLQIEKLKEDIKEERTSSDNLNVLADKEVKTQKDLTLEIKVIGKELKDD